MDKVKKMLNELNVMFTNNYDDNGITVTSIFGDLDSYFGGVLSIHEIDGLIEINNGYNDGLWTKENDLKFSIEWCIDEPILVISSSFHSFKFNDVPLNENVL